LRQISSGIQVRGEFPKKKLTVDILPALNGPYFAGLLDEFLSWRFVFWLVLPFIGLSVVLTIPAFRKFSVREESGLQQRPQRRICGAPGRWNVFAVDWTRFYNRLERDGACSKWEC
jgi:MFS family permease